MPTGWAPPLPTGWHPTGSGLVVPPTALTLYPLSTHATVAALRQRLLGTSQPATGPATPTPGTTLTAVGDATRRTTNGFFLLNSYGTGGSGSSGQPGPDGSGFIFTSAALAGHHFVAGQWTIKLRFKATAAVTGHFRLRLRKWNKASATGGYTTIGSNITGALSVTTGFQVFTFTVALPASATFAAGEVLYMDHTYANTAAYPATPTVTFAIRIGATCRIVTPGYV